MKNLNNTSTPAQELRQMERDAYYEGFSNTWLRQDGESVRFYASECQQTGKEPTFDGLVPYLRTLLAGTRQHRHNREDCFAWEALHVSR